MKSQLGITILEILLVLVIAASIILFGLRQYQLSKTDSDIEQLRFNVDQLFLAMGEFYKASCQIRYNQSTGSPIAGTGILDPRSNPTDPYGTTIVALQNNGYLPTTFQLLNTLVDDTAAASGYALQFNRAGSDTMRYVTTCFSWNSPTCSTPQAMNVINPAINRNNVVIWRAQIAIAIKDVSKIETYKNLLGADCVSGLSSTNPAVVAPCRTNPPAVNYLVWERLPSFTSSKYPSIYWGSMPYVKSFKQQYTNDVMYELSNPNWGSDPQYYLCGG